MRLLTMSAEVAAEVAGPRLKPRRIAAGPEAGAFVLPLAVLEDPAHAAARPRLIALETLEIDPAAAWPDAD